MHKQIAAFIICFIVTLALTGCGSKYSNDDFIGKTSIQIDAEFGKFDCCGKPIGTDGMYRNTSCGYTVREPQVGFLGTNPEWLIFIVFDENGIACETYEGYRPGG